MSPVGGVGINLAVQDAVATARLLGPPLLARAVGSQHLAKVQKRRAWPASTTQNAQVIAHRFVLLPALDAKSPPQAPLLIKLLDNAALLRGITAKALGLGLRPEHWKATTEPSSVTG